MPRLHLARVGRGDDHADGFLVEPLEAALPLEIFQVAANRAIAHETLGLRRRQGSMCLNGCLLSGI